MADTTEVSPHYAGNKGTPRYELLLVSTRDQDVDLLLTLKKCWATARERVLQQQKAAGKAGDREWARSLKETSSELMQLQRAACLFLGWLACTPPGDSPWRPIDTWAWELAGACARVDALVCQPELAHRELDSWRLENPNVATEQQNP
jgi:hypothetical protein